MKLTLTLALGIAVLAPSSYGEGEVQWQEALKITVSPEFVEPGQTVTVTLSNFGDTRYLLPSGCLFTEVVDGDDGTGRAVRSYVCTANMPILYPRDSISKSWDLTDDYGNPVPLGVYSFPIDVLTPDGRSIPFTPNVIFGLTLDDAPSCGVDYYGDCGPGLGGIAPELFPLGAPQVGNGDFILHVQFGLGAAPALLLIGAESGQVPCSIGMLAIEPAAPWIAIPLILRGEPGVIGAGNLDLYTPIPDDPSLGGLTAYFQVVAEDRGSLGGMSHSAGLALTLCE